MLDIGKTGVVHRPFVICVNFSTDSFFGWKFARNAIADTGWKKQETFERLGS